MLYAVAEGVGKPATAPPGFSIEPSPGVGYRHIETVRFDRQKMQNPEISGVEYQQGELQGYEVRQYLLEKWGRKCAYCGKKNTPLEVEHIVPKSRGGSNRVSNLTLACIPYNQKKNQQTAAEFGYPNIQAKAKQPLKDAAAVNATRYAIGRAIQSVGLATSFWSGGRTQKNRISQGYTPRTIGWMRRAWAKRESTGRCPSKPRGAVRGRPSGRINTAFLGARPEGVSA